MSRIITINGTERMICKNNYGVYIAYLDLKDIKWINDKSKEVRKWNKKKKNIKRK